MIIEDFDKNEPLDWFVVNDGVMGGRSQSRIEILEEGLGRFSGKVSLENNGGFASTRAELAQAVPPGTRKITARLKGDGKRYSFRIRTSGSFSRVSYKMEFDTRAGAWEIHEFPLENFIPTFRGRTLEDVPDIEASRIEQVGFLIADKQEGEFELLVDWIKAD